MILILVNFHYCDSETIKLFFQELTENNMKKFQVSFIIVFLLIISFSTCLKNKATKQIVEIKNGVKTIINPDEPITNAPVEYYELIEELSIGVDEGDSNYVFGRPTIGFVDQKKNIYVIDDMFYRVSKFDSTGKFILSFGRKGQGPGEFGSISSMLVSSDGKIYVTDSGNRRMNIFDKNGKYLNDFKIHYRERILHKPKAQTLLLMEDIADYRNHISHHYFTTYCQTGVLIDTILTVNQDVFSVWSGSGGSALYLHPFFYSFDTADNIYVIFDKKYVIRKYDSQGDLNVEFNRKYNSVAYTKKEKENYRVGTITINGVKHSPPIPDYRYDIYKIFFMPNNELWVMTSTVDKKSGRLFDVFDTQGNYIRNFFISR